MLKKILAISGKPGLFELVSQGKNMLIVASLKDGKKQPAYTSEKILSLGDIAMYTNGGEVPLAEVLLSVKTKQNGEKIAIDTKKASGTELADFMSSVLPDYDRDRVYSSDIKKLINWYNILVESNHADFENDVKPAEKAEA